MAYPDVFSLANAAAVAAWAALVLLPRWPVLTALLRGGLIPALALFYASVVMVHHFQVPGGGFGSIEEVRALLASDAGLLAGWVHYLAFDLFVGLWIAGRADAMGMSRLVQVPILLATFMFGPLGLLLFQGSALPSALMARLGRRAPA